MYIIFLFPHEFFLWNRDVNPGAFSLALFSFGRVVLSSLGLFLPELFLFLVFLRQDLVYLRLTHTLHILQNDLKLLIPLPPLPVTTPSWFESEAHILKAWLPVWPC